MSHEEGPRAFEQVSRCPFVMISGAGYQGRAPPRMRPHLSLLIRDPQRFTASHDREVLKPISQLYFLNALFLWLSYQNHVCSSCIHTAYMVTHRGNQLRLQIN